MGKIDYKAIYDKNKHGWYDMTEDPQKYEALLAGHYSDSNHFVYELLQNAEDAFERDENGRFNPETCAHADKVVIEYYQDKLIFYHNGKPFDESDVRGVSSMLMGTKDRDDAQTIGRFGMGFKSVFKYTYQPEIYSDNEAFKITRYLLPVEITDGWNCEAEKKAIVCKLGEGRTFMPFLNEKHLTKIVIPFLKYGKNGELVSVPGDDVLKKLDELNGEILLFLTHIQNLYWVNKETGKFAYITLKQDEKDEKLITCRIEGTEYKGKEEISRYLKFKRIFNHPEMDNAEVSVAYKLNSRADNINEVENSSIWVYFPTRDTTDLPFLIHGSFETAVSREKLMTPSSFNDELFDELGDLIADSMEELARRKLITQVFLRRSVLATFDDEEKNNTIPGLKRKLTNVFKEKELLPDRNGNYKKADVLMLPVPFRMIDFCDRPLFRDIFPSEKEFVAFNNEREANFNSYFNWLVQDLGISLYKLSNFAKSLTALNGKTVNPVSGQFEALKDCYDFLSDNRESVYTTGLSYSRSGAYESAIRQDISTAWKELRKAPIILNRLNTLVPAQKDGKAAIYLGASSEYKSVMQSALVNMTIASTFGKVLTEGFLVEEFNNFQYIKEKVIKKYIDIDDTVGFADLENFTDEYIEDLKQIFALVDETGNIQSIKDMLDNAYIIKVKTEDGEDSFARPKECYVPISVEGIDLEVYYSPVVYEETEEDELDDEDNWYGFDVFPIDKEYYENNGISISMLAKLGLIVSPVTDGNRSQEGVGDGHWVALGEFCPEIEVDGLDDNLCFIEEFPDLDIAKEKSREILKLVLEIAPKLQGQQRFRKNNPYTSELKDSYVLSSIKLNEWIYDKDMKINKPSSMSRYDLNSGLYSSIHADKSMYKIIGFVEKEIDGAQDALEKALNLNKQDKLILLKRLAKELGKEITDSVQDDWDDDEEESVFNPYDWEDSEFPKNRVNNIDYLIRHVQEQFYCADPTTYQKVWRQIRVSKNSKADRSYAIGMYTNASNTKICQMCKEPISFVEVDQIANFGIEMPQLNLCLCRECSAKYKAMRDGNKEEFKKQIRAAILSIDATEFAEDYSIEFNSDTVLHFTQTHIAEIQEILRLLAEYGTPENDSEEEDNTVEGPLMHPAKKEKPIATDQKNMFSDIDADKNTDEEVAREGCFITYKKKFSNDDIADNTLQPDKYPLHRAMLGHKVGDIIVFMGKEYEIIGII